MKLFIFITFFTFSLSEPINRESAIKVAKGHFVEHTGISRTDLIIDSIEELGDNKIKLYIIKFNPNGFSIVAADDRVKPVLAYSLDNEINLDYLPPQLLRILKSYQDGIDYVIDNNIESTRSIQNEWEKYLSNDIDINISRSVAPLLLSNWDQGGSWNDMCPGNALVGCVAVSMSQIMHYWQYPENGIGENTYLHEDYGEITVDFSNSIYDYQNMQNNYATISSQILLYDSGVSVNMDYGTDASGAYVVWGPNSAVNALVNHFQFSDEILAVYKSNYSDIQWDELLKLELNQSRPVIMRAYDEFNGSGHAWNIDGYQGENYFHCNWGWGGNSNGYFYLNNLNASGYNFIIDQAAITNIKPIYTGCTDPNALNYDSTAQVDDGSCFWQLQAPDNVVLLSEGNAVSIKIGYDYVFYPQVVSDDGDGTIVFAIKVENLTEPIAGFQFQLKTNEDNINQFEINDIYGGITEQNNFSIQEENNIILGFSFSGNSIPTGQYDMFYVSVSYDTENIDNKVMELLIDSNTQVVFSNINGNNLRGVYIPNQFQYGIAFSELNLGSSCGDEICSEDEINNCFIDCGEVNQELQYSIVINNLIQSIVQSTDSYTFNDLDYNTQYCFELKSFYNGQLSNDSNTSCIETKSPPQVEITHSNFNINMGINELYMDSIEITNLGNSSLRYELFSNVGNGNSSNFYGEYYSSPGTNGSPDFGDFIFSREDEFIDFNWGNNSPDQLLQSDDFQIRWSGDIYAEDNGLYSFRAYTDDGVRLYIDDVLVIDHWLSQAPTSRTGEIYLESGIHQLIMEYYEDGGGAVAQLYWTPPNDNETLVVPTDMGWLNFDKTESLIFPDQTDVISFIINSSNLNIGSYNGNLSVETNDPNSYTNIFNFNLNVGIADCFGTISGQAFLDDCGICSGGLSEHIPNSDVDCMGICFGNTTLDDCGICGGDNSYCSGCTNQNALNYNVNAIIDDNSCEFLGDINNDNNINVTDIVIMISIILDNQYNTYADMNFDNNINVVDIVILVDLILAE